MNFILSLLKHNDLTSSSRIIMLKLQQEAKIISRLPITMRFNSSLPSCRFLYSSATFTAYNETWECVHLRKIFEEKFVFHFDSKRYNNLPFLLICGLNGPKRPDV